MGHGDLADSASPANSVLVTQAAALVLSETSPSSPAAPQQACVPCHKASSSTVLSSLGWPVPARSGTGGPGTPGSHGTVSWLGCAPWLPGTTLHTQPLGGLYVPRLNLVLSERKIGAEQGKWPRAPQARGWGAGTAQLLPEAG